MFAPLGSTFRSPAIWTAFRCVPRPEGWAATLRRALSVMETRRELSGLDERLLRDIGVSKTEAAIEAARAPWDMESRRI
ncbi:MAG TPA: DUF1127 domain-containing protein [Roseomonas sp.]|nr:DUF1127 domain-containing protein [Roseomonas sp.]